MDVTFDKGIYLNVHAQKRLTYTCLKSHPCTYSIEQSWRIVCHATRAHSLGFVHFTSPGKLENVCFGASSWQGGIFTPSLKTIADIICLHNIAWLTKVTNGLSNVTQETYKNDKDDADHDDCALGLSPRLFTSFLIT